MRQLSSVDLSDSQYTIEQSSVRNKYKAMDTGGNTVLRGNHQMFQMKDEFQFTDAEENDVFTVTASGTVDIAGDYLLTDSQTGEDIAILDNDFSIFQDTWRIRDADDRSIVAELSSRGAVTTLARKLFQVGGLLPHKYEIVDETGDHVGSIEGQFSFRDRYEIRVDDASPVPTEPIVAGAMVIDAIQAN